MKLSEIKVLETSKMSNQDWAKDMIKIIKSVDSKRYGRLFYEFFKGKRLQLIVGE